MLVNWKHPRLLKAGSSTDRTALVLKPGVNDVDATLWEHASRTPLFKHYLADGSLEVVGAADEADADDAGKGEQTGETADLSGFNESKAKKIVKDTNDEMLLMKWHEAEKRAGVQKAIEAQLEVLAKAGKPADAKE